MSRQVSKRCILLLATFFALGILQAQSSGRLGIPEAPPLRQVLDSVAARDHALSAQRHRVESKRANYEAVGRQWAYRVFTDLGYSYANNVNATTVASDNGGFESLSLQNGTVLRAGLTVRLTLFDLIGRPHLRDQAFAEFAASEEVLADMEDHLLQEAESLYYQMLEARREVEIRYELEQTLSSAYQMSREAFRMGDADMDKFSQVAERYAKARIATETARSRYLSRYRRLENRAGFSFR
jgi:outer membrane protein TolC